jgi:hypothetical protein
MNGSSDSRKNVPAERPALCSRRTFAHTLGEGLERLQRLFVLGRYHTRVELQMARLSSACLLLAALPELARGGLSYPDCTSGPLKSNLVCSTSATPEARAKALVAAMSNGEKLANLIK